MIWRFLGHSGALKCETKRFKENVGEKKGLLLLENTKNRTFHISVTGVNHQGKSMKVLVLSIRNYSVRKL